MKLTSSDALSDLPDGARIEVAGEILTMNRDYPRIAFDCSRGGHIYPYHVFDHFGVAEVNRLDA